MSRNVQVLKPVVVRRLGLEGQEVFGIEKELSWGVIIGEHPENPEAWLLSSGRKVYKKNQNKTWEVNGNLMGHRIYGIDPAVLWGTVRGEWGNHWVIQPFDGEPQRYIKKANQNKTWFVGSW